MQFILTLLISVRGRELLKDGSDLFFFGNEAGVTDTGAGRRPGRTRSGPRCGWVCVECCESRIHVMGKEKLSSEPSLPSEGALAWESTTSAQGSVWVTPP